MPKVLLDEAERFLLKNWEEARLLEKSMEGVRAKYKNLFQQIIDEVVRRHSALDASFAYPTQFWDGGGCIGVGRKAWPQGDEGWPPGFWVWHLRLEDMAVEDSEPPYSCIWVSNKSAKKCNFNTVAAKSKLLAAASELLSPEERDPTADDGDNTELLHFPSPSKGELLNLLAEGDGQKFVQRLVRQFDIMTKFIPLMDQLFGVSSSK